MIKMAFQIDHSAPERRIDQKGLQRHEYPLRNHYNIVIKYEGYGIDFMCISSNKDNSWFLGLIFILDDGVILQVKETQEQEEKHFIQAEMPPISQPFECEFHQTRNLSLFFFLKRFFCFCFLNCFWLHWVFAAACGLFLGAASWGCSSSKCSGFSFW